MFFRRKTPPPPSFQDSTPADADQNMRALGFSDNELQFIDQQAREAFSTSRLHRSAANAYTMLRPRIDHFEEVYTAGQGPAQPYTPRADHPPGAPARRARRRPLPDQAALPAHPAPDHIDLGNSPGAARRAPASRPQSSATGNHPSKPQKVPDADAALLPAAMTAFSAGSP